MKQETYNEILDHFNKYGFLPYDWLKELVGVLKRCGDVKEMVGEIVRNRVSKDGFVGDIGIIEKEMKVISTYLLGESE